MKQKISIALVLAMMLALLAGCTGTTVVYSPVIESTTPAETGAPTAAPASGAVKTGLAIIPSISDSVSASADAEGEIKYDVTLAAVTVTDDGVIESCIIDSVPASVKFDAAGKITSDLSAPISTKNDLGDDYGMKAWGSAIAEWNEQAASFAAYVTGKTPADVAGIAVNEKTAPTDADLATSVTIAVGGFQALIAKAAGN